MAWIHLAISSSSPLLLTCLVGSVLEISTFKHQVLSSGRNYLPPDLQDTYIKYLCGTPMLLRALKVLHKWETAAGTIALGFAVTSLCSDFPWHMELSAEWKTKPETLPKNQTTRRKPSEQNPSYTKCRTVCLWTSPTETSLSKYYCWDKL